MSFVPNEEIVESDKIHKLKLKFPDGRYLGEINILGGTIAGKTITLKISDLLTFLQPIKTSEEELKVAYEPTQDPVIEESSQSENAGNSSTDFPKIMDETERIDTDEMSAKSGVCVQSAVESLMCGGNEEIVREEYENNDLLHDWENNEFFGGSILLLDSEIMNNQCGLNNTQNIESGIKNFTQILPSTGIITLSAANYDPSIENEITCGSDTTSLPHSSEAGEEEKFPVEHSTSNFTNSSNITLTAEEFEKMFYHNSKLTGTANLWDPIDKREIAGHIQCVKRYPSTDGNGKTFDSGVRIVRSNKCKKLKIDSIVRKKVKASKIDRNYNNNLLRASNKSDMQKFSTKCKNYSHDADSIPQNSQFTENSTYAIQNNTNIMHCSERESRNDTNIILNNAKQKDSYSSLDIVHEALRSLTDQDLRVKALMALADCGIGVGRLVPKRLPSDPTSVEDKQTQTEVLGPTQIEKSVELEENCQDSSRIENIDETDQYLTHINQDIAVQKFLQSYEHLDLTSCPDVVDLDFDIDLLARTVKSIDSNPEIGTSKHWNAHLEPNLVAENAYATLDKVDFRAPKRLASMEKLIDSNPDMDTSEIWDAHSKPSSFIKAAYTLLNEDFLNAKIWDDNGLLGIHKAVLKGSVRDLKRQIIVLKALKKDVDLRTMDRKAGMTAKCEPTFFCKFLSFMKTSLELAVEQDVDPDKVRLLLKAGAQTASAIIIACIKSSDILPDLVNSIKSNQPLDTLDSKGFTPLHYCSRLGNIIGVKALVNSGANVNTCDGKFGGSPLFYALIESHDEVAKFLSDHGAVSTIESYPKQTAVAS